MVEYIESYINVYYKVYPLRSGIAGAILILLCITPFPVFLNKIKQILARCGLKDRAKLTIVSYCIAIPIWCSVTATLLFGAAVFVFNSYVKPKCERQSSFDDAKTRGAAGLRAFQDECVSRGSTNLWAATQELKNLENHENDDAKSCIAKLCVTNELQQSRVKIDKDFPDSIFKYRIDTEIDHCAEKYEQSKLPICDQKDHFEEAKANG